jgi:capsular polysaccharide biosynthesis protein
MDEPFDPIAFASYVRTHWRIPLISCGIAVVIAVTASLVLPKRYTATASLLIEPPAGNDPRAATAVSPVYLESLKAFERIASNDTLFLEALKRLHIAEAASGRSVDSLKREILKVAKPASTSVLEIKATLHDPRSAQALAQYIAEHTVELRRSFDANSEDDVTMEARRILGTAQNRLRSAQAARDAFTATDPIEALEDEVSNAGELLFRLRRDISAARAELAEYAARQQQPAAAPNSPPEWIRQEITRSRARIEQYERQEHDLTRIIETKSSVLEDRKNRREVLETELRAARGEYESANTKLNDIRASAVFRGERLQVIDPGMVPDRPSSPNLPLNVAVALLLSIVASTVYLALRFSQARAGHSGEARTYTTRYAS